MRDLAGIAEINGPRRAELQAERAANIAANARPKLTEPAWFYQSYQPAAKPYTMQDASAGLSPEPEGRDC